jgi:3-oxoacyl-[acyl-carrier-protein] synthase II
VSPGVVVTGIGAICAAGDSVPRLWDGMVAAEAKPVPVDDEFARMPYPILYPVAEPTRQVPGAADQPSTGARTTQLALAAAREALAMAGPGAAGDPDQARRFGVVVGTGMGESGAHELRRTADGRSGVAGDRPIFSVAGELARAVGARGPVVSVSNACAASAYAIGTAADLLEHGECDVVLACGAESYSRVALACFNRMGAIDPQACRPFSQDRQGTVFGEGAGVLVLERADRAAARAAAPLARLAGAGFSCDADHPTAPSPEGIQAERALRAALGAAGIEPSGVGAVVPHGTGTEHNDLVESQVMSRVFGSGMTSLPLYSLKALIGHTGGAAGALAAVAAVEVVRRGEVPPNVDVGPRDPALEVRLESRRAELSAPVVLVNAYAFGGNNASLVFVGAS